MAIENKITFEDKVGLVPKEVHIHQVWDEDVNEIKSKHNLNDDRIGNVEANQLSGVLYFNTKALMLAADATGQLNYAYKVIADTDTSLNGDYTSDGVTYTQQTNAVNGIIESGNVDAVSGGEAFKYITEYNHFDTLIGKNLFNKNNVTWPRIDVGVNYSEKHSQAYDILKMIDEPYQKALEVWSEKTGNLKVDLVTKNYSIKFFHKTFC